MSQDNSFIQDKQYEKQNPDSLEQSQEKQNSGNLAEQSKQQSKHFSDQNQNNNQDQSNNLKIDKDQSLQGSIVQVSSLEYEKISKQNRNNEILLQKIAEENKKLKEDIQKLENDQSEVCKEASQVNNKQKNYRGVQVQSQKLKWNLPKAIELTEDQKKLEEKISSLNREMKKTKQYEQKLEANNNGKRKRELEDQIKSVNQAIDSSQDSIKQFQKILDGHQTKIQELQSSKNITEIIAKMQSEEKEIKNNIQRMKKESYQLDQESKATQINLTQLKQIFREVCNQAKIHPVFEEQPAVDQNQKVQKKKQRIIIDQKTKADEIAQEAKIAKLKKEKSSPDNYQASKSKSCREKAYVPKFKQQKIQEVLNEVEEENKQQLQVTKEKYIEYKQKIIDLKTQYEENQKLHDNQMKRCNNRIKELQLQQKDLLNREKEKDAESRISIAKFNEFKRITNHKSPKDYSFSVFPTKEINQQYQQKKYWQKALIECKFRPTKRELIGELPENYPMIFDDFEQIGVNQDFNQKACKIVIYHDESQRNIFGFQITYFLGNNEEEKIGQQNIFYKNVNSDLVMQTKLDIEDTDSLRFVSGFFKEKINYLKFETQYGNQISVGQVNHREKYKEFHLELKQNDIPILFFGVLDQEKNCAAFGNYVLICFGIEIYNPTHNYNIRQNHLKNPVSNSRFIDQSQLIEENILVEKENTLLHGRRGLFQNRVKPIVNEKK